MEKRVLRSLARHGTLSQTGLYRYFHRYRANLKNGAVNDLLKKGWIDLEIKRTSITARKPTRFFTITALGRRHYNEGILEVVKL